MITAPLAVSSNNIVLSHQFGEPLDFKSRFSLVYFHQIYLSSAVLERFNNCINKNIFTFYLGSDAVSGRQMIASGFPDTFSLVQSLRFTDLSSYFI